MWDIINWTITLNIIIISITIHKCLSMKYDNILAVNKLMYTANEATWDTADLNEEDN